MWNTVLFDLDGTLTDSGEGITKCVQYALNKEFGIVVNNLHELDSFVGPPLKEQFMKFASLTEEEGIRAVNAYRERYRTVGMYENRLYPGIPELLRQLSAEHFTLAVSSSKPTDFCREILRYFGIDSFFTAVVGSEMDGRRVEKKDVLAETLRQLGMENMKDRAVLVGDRNYDVLGAKEAGIASIGVTYGYGSRTELEDSVPDCIVDNTTELRNVLIGQARSGKERPSSAPVSEIRTSPAADGNILFKIWRVIYPVGLPLCATFLVTMLLGALILTLQTLTGGSGSVSDYMQSIEKWTIPMAGAADAVCIVAMLPFFIGDERKRRVSGRRDRLLIRNRFNVLFVAEISLLVISVSNILDTCISTLQINDPAYSAVAEALYNSSGVAVQILVIGIIGPVSEEIIFRGLVYRRLRDYTGVLPAAVLSGLIFGIYHGNLTQGIFAFCVGILLALLYEHFGTLWASIAAHMANNLFSVLISAYGGSLLNSPVFSYTLLFSSILLAAGLSWEVFRRKNRVNFL